MLHELGSRSNGGWLEKEYHYMSWALSCLLLRRYYEVELVTDAAGKELLIDLLELPYASVSVALNQLDGYHHDLWALGKIYTYSIQHEPFIHVDGDFYLRGRLGEPALRAALLTQTKIPIDNAGFYYFLNYLKNNTRQHTRIFPALGSGNSFEGLYNPGVIGGNDARFLSQYAGAVLQYVHENADLLSKSLEFVLRDSTINPHVTNPLDLLNAILEQYTFARMAQQAGIRVTCLHEEKGSTKFLNASFFNCNQSPLYVHPVHHFKKDLNVCRQVAFKLRQSFPEYYYKIKHLVKTFQI